MKVRNITFLLTLVIFAMALLFVQNFISLFKEDTQEKFISRGQIRGMALEYNGKPYTLNFDQETKVAELLNHSVKIGLEGYFIGEENNFEYGPLIIYQFGKPDIIIKPVSFANDQLIFQAQEWNPKGLLRETGPGELHSLFLDSYDKE